MTLTYWVAENTTDAQCYNIREKTRKACWEMIVIHGEAKDFAPPRKVTVEYRDAFDLLDQCMGEDKVYEGGSNG